MSSVLRARPTNIYQVEMDVKNEANVEIDCPETAIEHKNRLAICSSPFASPLRYFNARHWPTEEAKLDLSPKFTCKCAERVYGAKMLRRGEWCLEPYTTIPSLFVS